MFYSTNYISSEVNFKTALFTGLASDEGLYMPTSFPQFSVKELTSLSQKTLPEIGEFVLQKWINDIPSHTLKRIIAKSLNFPIPLREVGNYTFLELSHGPTKAFKDIAAGVLAQLFAYYLKKDDRKITILVATSGDTGGAIAQAFSGLDRVKVVILYPLGRVSRLQEEQLTRVSGNVFPLAINGVFDDCQAIVKKAFVEPDLATLHLSSANSINIGRLIAQIIYYVWCYSKLQKKNLRFVVPSGNMGDVTAGLFAKKMGLPFSSFVIATNENDAAVKYYKTGIFFKQKTKHTLSTAMDIGNPSNFIRILELFHNDHEAFCENIQVIKVSDKKTVQTIKNVFAREKYLMDFHTAVGYSAAEKTRNDTFSSVILSTASPQKFASEITEQTGIVVDDSKDIVALQNLAKKFETVENSYEAVKERLLHLH